MVTCTLPRLIFKHMVELPHCECVFCSTQEEDTGRSRIYLVFKDKQRIYSRNGMKGHWDPVLDEEEHENVWEGFEQAIMSRMIPSFVANDDQLAMV